MGVFIDHNNNGVKISVVNYQVGDTIYCPDTMTDLELEEIGLERYVAPPHEMSASEIKIRAINQRRTRYEQEVDTLRNEIFMEALRDGIEPDYTPALDAWEKIRSEVVIP